MKDIDAGPSKVYSLETVPHRIHGRDMSYFMNSVVREVFKKMSIKHSLGQHSV